jgi:uncharacterized membrane protein YkvA (DUF1232 family)
MNVATVSRALSKVPSKALLIAVTVVWVVYLVSPIDLIPDFFGLFGRVDDVAVGVFLYRLYRHHRAHYGSPSRPSTETGRGETVSKEATSGDPYTVLGVASNATRAEVEQQFRTLMQQYHPDKVAHLGAELRSLAHEKCLELQRARERILQRLGA